MTTTYDNDDYQDEMIADLFGASNFKEEEPVKAEVRSPAPKPPPKLTEGPTDPVDEDIQNMVRQDVRRMMAKIKTEQKHRNAKQMDSRQTMQATEEVEENPAKYEEAQQELFKKIKKEKIKKKKTTSSRKKAGTQKPKKDYYKNYPRQEPEHIDVTDLTEEAYEERLISASNFVEADSLPTSNARKESSTEDIVPSIKKNTVKPETTSSNNKYKAENADDEEREDVVSSERQRKKQDSAAEKPEANAPGLSIDGDNKKIPAPRQKFGTRVAPETDPNETVELVLVDNSEKMKQLEEENKRLKDTLNFLQQTAVDKERYYAELAWFGKSKMRLFRTDKPFELCLSFVVFACNV